MKKYLKYITFSMVFFIVCVLKVSALDCEYTDGKTNAYFRINEGTIKIQYSGISGTITTTDPSHQNGINETQSVENWGKGHKKNQFTGKEYYILKGSCPPFAILVDRKSGFDLFVSDDQNLQHFKDYAADKQGIAIMNLLVPDSKEEDKDFFPESCLGLNEASCKDNKNFACVWVDKDDYDFLEEGYCNVDKLLYVSCGGANGIPLQVPALISMLVNLLKIATPIILIFVSIITLLKALAAGKDDEIKKAQSSLIKKIIAAALVFFVVAIVQFIVSKVANDEEDYKNFGNCLDCFLNNSCGENTYYNTVVNGDEYCTYLTTGNSDLCNPKK